MFSTEIKAGDQIRIGSAILTLKEKKGKRARISIDTGGQIVSVVRESSRQERTCEQK